MQPVVLSHETEFAPALTGEAGSLYTLFKWALPQLGWTLAFDDEPGKRAAFRNDPAHGTGYYLMIWDDPADHAADARKARAQVYLDMLDIDNGVDPVFSVERYIPKSVSLDSAQRQWFVIGDAQRFHFMREADGQGSHDGFNWLPIGDFKPYFPNDSGPFMCPLSDDPAANGQSAGWGVSELAYTSSSSSGVSRTDHSEGFALSFAGIGSATLRPRSFSPGSNDSAVYGSSGSTLGDSTPAARVVVSEGWAPRGEIVGALNPLQDRPFGNGFQEVEDVHNGRELTTCLYFNATPYFGENTPGRGSIYIDIGSDWSDW